MISQSRVIFLMVLAVLITALGANPVPPSASANLTPVLNVNPSLAIPNQIVTLFGRDYTASGQITGNGASVISINGSALSSPDVTYPVNLDSQGNWAASITVPQTTQTIAGTPIQVTAVDNQGVTQTTQLDFVTPAIRVDPPSSSRGSDLLFSGIGFPSSNTATAPKVQVSITYAGTELGIITPDYFGELDAIFEVPVSVETPSENAVQARIIGYNKSIFTTHTVPGASVVASPTSGKSGSIVLITASDFPSLAPVSSIRVGNIIVTGSPTPTADRNGDFNSSFIMPLLTTGVHTITATAGGISAVIPFTIIEGTEEGQQIPGAGQATGPAKALVILSNNDNLIRVWTFNNASKSWAFYDPRPAFSKANSITTMIPGQVYWLRLNKVQTATLNGQSRVLFQGWNLLPW